MNVIITSYLEQRSSIRQFAVEPFKSFRITFQGTFLERLTHYFLMQKCINVTTDFYHVSYFKTVKENNKN